MCDNRATIVKCVSSDSGKVERDIDAKCTIVLITPKHKDECLVSSVCVCVLTVFFHYHLFLAISWLSHRNGIFFFRGHKKCNKLSSYTTFFFALKQSESRQKTHEDLHQQRLKRKHVVKKGDHSHQWGWKIGKRKTKRILFKLASYRWFGVGWVIRSTHRPSLIACFLFRQAHKWRYVCMHTCTHKSTTVNKKRCVIMLSKCTFKS